MKSLLSSLALALALALGAAAAPAQAALFQDAQLQTLLDNGQADELERLARQRLQAQPDDPQATAALALAQADLVDASAVKQSTARVQQCVQRHPDEAACHYALAMALGMQVRSGGAFKALSLAGQIRSSLQRAIELAPNTPEPRSALQQIYLALPSLAGGGADKARELEKGVKDADQLRLMRARAAAKQKDWAAMERELRAVRAKGRPDLLLELRVAASDLGREWMHQGQHAKALEWFEQLNKEQPQQAIGVYNLARVLDAMGEPEKAVRQFERAKTLMGAEALAIDYRLGMTLQGQGDKAGARAAYERALAGRRLGAKDAQDMRRRLAEL